MILSTLSRSPRLKPVVVISGKPRIWYSLTGTRCIAAPIIPSRPPLGVWACTIVGRTRRITCSIANNETMSCTGVIRRVMPTPWTGIPSSAPNTSRSFPGEERACITRPRLFIYPTWPRKKVRDIGTVVM